MVRSVRSAAPASQRTSEGFEVFREGLDLLEAVVADPENVVVGPQAFYLDSYGYQGFVHDLVSDYRVLSVVRTKPGAAFFISKPARGTYYPAFIMYDEQGVPDQVVTYFVGNERKGVAGRRRPRQSFVPVRAGGRVRVHRQRADHADDAGQRRRLVSDRKPVAAQGQAAAGAAQPWVQFRARGPAGARGKAAGADHLDHRLGDTLAA